MAAQQIIFLKHVKTVFVQVLSFVHDIMQCGCMNCCFVVKAPANATMQRKQRQLGQKQFLTYFTNLIAVQPSMAKYEWTMLQMKVENIMLSCTEISFHRSFFYFTILRNLESNPGFLFSLTLYTCRQILWQKFAKLYKKERHQTNVWSVTCMHQRNKKCTTRIYSVPDVNIQKFVTQQNWDKPFPGH